MNVRDELDSDETAATTTTTATDEQEIEEIQETDDDLNPPEKEKEEEEVQSVEDTIEKVMEEVIPDPEELFNSAAKRERFDERMKEAKDDTFSER